ncbi:hypothetical protein [Planomonospora venezuelensis]|uniref:Protein kinase domain-containing protein n=1 Tax=Planomonospora venezuelensis TaxID=1999 RepID=A0A841DC48_PLAVE|nr:hypothetical protein [Planomonospora venezuelensis]MBB5966034.1 hypothetical protein [Planomonospora venezuelensis]GIN05700.1 hypothetical protein Pve01_73580 [Planomonospora venezuelensis]
MRTWSDSPFDRTVPLSTVARYTDEDVIARDNGESSVIYEPPGFRGWLVKMYRPEKNVDHKTLGRLIELPETMLPGELSLIDRGIAWPVARVVEGYRTVGSIMAKAEPEFFWDVKLIGERTVRKTVEIDYLANTADRLRGFGFPVPSVKERLGVMRTVVACAALFEKYDIVYADWSFANAFWSPRTQSTLIIDVDASGIGCRGFVETPNWEDPLMGKGRAMTTHTDRYKVALLVTRAVTGHRGDRWAALAEMERTCPDHSRLTGLLRRALEAKTIDLRPTLAELHQAIVSPAGQTVPKSRPPGGSNVTVLRPWRPPVARPEPSASSPLTPGHAPGTAPSRSPARAKIAGMSAPASASPGGSASPGAVPKPPIDPTVSPSTSAVAVGCLIMAVVLTVVIIAVHFLATRVF